MTAPLVAAPAPRQVPPDEDVYFELNMVDAGSGKCLKVLAPDGVPEKGQRRLKSISCKVGAP